MKPSTTTSPTKPFEPSPSHQRLHAVAGAWRGSVKTFFDPSTPAEETTMEATAELLMGGRHSGEHVR